MNIRIVLSSLLIIISFSGCFIFHKKILYRRIISLEEGELDTIIAFKYLDIYCQFNKEDFVQYISKIQINDIEFKDSLLAQLQSKTITINKIEISNDPRLYGICEKYLAQNLLEGIANISHADSKIRIEKIKYRKFKMREYGKCVIKEEFIDIKTKKIILERILSIS